MCGITGEMTFGGSQPPVSVLEQANEAQRPRGPDGGGIYRLANAALGHRRLKIFDLSDRAAQPMVDADLGLAMVYNGAIYNFKELRAELQAKGYGFISGSDTEVLLKAYHAWGPDCVLRLCGMFSFAVWERDTGRLVLARDRLGIKPLYYARTNGGFRFASTTQALLQYKDIDTSLNAEALHYYLTFHAVPEPLTLLSGIRKLSAGHILTVHSDGSMEERPYWRFRFDYNSHDMSEAHWLQATDEALRVAARRQLCADVPVGVLLSGGLDSSLLVALADQECGQPLETFSIGFESAQGEIGDEFYYSDIIARHFHTRHHKLFISNAELTDSLGDCVRAMCEPMVSHDNIGFYLLSREVSRHVKVVLSGQGADEMFAGYRWFQKVANTKLVNAQDAADLTLKTIADRDYAEYAATVTGDYRVRDKAREFLLLRSAANGSHRFLDHLLEYESTFALANGPLERVDNMTMSASLEARVPFLDEAVIDLALAMPPEFKLPDGGKYLIKKLARQMLPAEVVDRPKGYFPVPALKYLQGPTLELMHDILSPARVKERGVFNPDMVEDLLANPHDHITLTGGSKLWQLGLLEFWLQQQGV